MKNCSPITRFSIKHPKTITAIMLAVTFTIALIAALPMVWPELAGTLNPVKVDTDPENMLPKDEAVRIFHTQMKKEFELYDILVVGVVNEKNKEGVFNPESLRRIHELTEYAKTLRWEDKDNPGEYEGVVDADIIAPSTVDNVEPGSLGEIKFEWLMQNPPATEEEAVAVREKAERLPFMKNTLVSGDGKAVMVYLPLTSKDMSYKVAAKLKEKVAGFGGDEKYYITGLPVAEDTFGVEMFRQMAISAPLAMLIIFLLMLFFFKKVMLVVSPLIVAVVSVIATMGLLVATGNTIHIMSSMIPIFIMPIAVLDAVHILSEFFDRYRAIGNRRETISEVMNTLFTPMLYTSLTTAVGFASLALAPIPPVQVFGLFVAFGVMLAWLWTVTFIPAFIMFIPEKSLKNFGLKQHDEASEQQSRLGRFLAWFGEWVVRRAKPVLAAFAVLTLIAVYGLSQININDNPVRWFEPSHPIREADRVLNEHFGGTYMAYLAFEPEAEQESPEDAAVSFGKSAAEKAKALEEDGIGNAGKIFAELADEANRLAGLASSKKNMLDLLESFADENAQNASDEEYDAWDAASLFVSEQKQKDEIFKNPEVLNYISGLQQYLLSVKSDSGADLVGKSNSLPDLVKTVYRELLGGKEENYKIPATSSGVAQTILQYESSHRPKDIWHFVSKQDKDNTGFRKANIWIQLKSGDNRDMAKLVGSVDEYLQNNPAPVALKHGWYGLTYINVVWQGKMVSGMLQAFLGSFVVVLLMMIILFRSALWGLLSMIPLVIAIALIYGFIGLIGKDYDMPVAVLSSLSLGLAVDYAIHFLARSRQLRGCRPSWKETIGPLFGEPARAITRNVVVIGIGFLPLLLAPLRPYKTVGAFIAAILLLAGVTSLMILPALITLLEKNLFHENKKKRIVCRCTTCIAASITVIAVIIINLYQIINLGTVELAVSGLGALLVMTGLCSLSARHKSCREATCASEVK